MPLVSSNIPEDEVRKMSLLFCLMWEQEGRGSAGAEIFLVLVFGIDGVSESIQPLFATNSSGNEGYAHLTIERSSFGPFYEVARHGRTRSY
jgi:hypothetical protein